MRPEREGQAGTSDNAAKQTLRPGRVTHDPIESSSGQRLPQAKARTPQSLGAAQANLTKDDHRRAGGLELMGQPAVEAQGELVVSGLAAERGQREQNGLDPALEVAAVDMERAHHACAITCS